MPKSIQRRATVADLRGPATLRSGLVSRLAPGLDDLEPCELIGEGKYGVVHKMIEKQTGQLRVVKTVERPAGWDDQQLKMEAEILQNLDHPHILRIFSWVEDGDAVDIVMEHCDGGEVMKVVSEGRTKGQEVPENWAATCIRQCFEALVYLHSKGIIHKDLKSANILLLQSTESAGKVFGHMPHVVICDLGLAEVTSRGIFGTAMGGGRGNMVAGTPVTMAPEVWKGNFGPKSDVWSMGVVMYQILTGFLPFKPEKNEASLWAEAHRKGPNWNLFNRSQDALRMCEWLLQVQEAKRPSAAEALDHAWLKRSYNRQMSKEEINSLATAVRTWKTRNPMQRALCLKMAANCTCLKKFAALFSQFDTDNSGILDQGELLPALESLGMDKVMAREIAASLDVNNDGSCEYLEFAAACLSSLEEEFDELLRQEFNAKDTKRRGWLSDEQMEPLIDELRPLAIAHGLEIQDLDANGDGVISFREFCEYFGRPGARYKNKSKGSVHRTELPVKQLPMKQQVRILREEESVDQFRSAMAASMEASMKSRGDSGADEPRMATVTEGGQERDDIVDRILLRMQQHKGNTDKSPENGQKTIGDKETDAKEPEAEMVESETDKTESGSEMELLNSRQGSGRCNVSFEEADVKALKPNMATLAVPKDPSRNGSTRATDGGSDMGDSGNKNGSSKLLLSADSEQAVTSFQCSHASQQSEKEYCVGGCWLYEGPLRWLGIKGPALCGKSVK